MAAARRSRPRALAGGAGAARAAPGEHAGPPCAATRDVYDRLFDLVPWHEANTIDPDRTAAYEDLWFRLYGPLTRPSDTVVDLGCGSGALVRRFAADVDTCIDVDTSEAMIAIAGNDQPSNARFEVDDLIRPSLPACSADLVVTRQGSRAPPPGRRPRPPLVGAANPAPGRAIPDGDPSRLTGPWDISRGFAPTATGLHLHEFTNGELARLLREAGFAGVRTPLLPSTVRLGNARLNGAWVPVGGKATLESVLSGAPSEVRAKVAGPLSIREVVLLARRPRS